VYVLLRYCKVVRNGGWSCPHFACLGALPNEFRQVTVSPGAARNEIVALERIVHVPSADPSGASCVEIVILDVGACEIDITG
jgi:hypothetical protein